jgi:hypothetical protein
VLHRYRVLAGARERTDPAQRPSVYVIDHVADGDTVALRNGQRVRLVQIDTPEVYFGTECYGPQASATTKRLLPPGTRVWLFVEPATDPVDQYGRLHRCIVRMKDGLNVNVQLVPGRCRCAVLLRGVGMPPRSNGSHCGRRRRSSVCGHDARTLPTRRMRGSTRGDRPSPKPGGGMKRRDLRGRCRQERRRR